MSQVAHQHKYVDYLGAEELDKSWNTNVKWDISEKSLTLKIIVKVCKADDWLDRDMLILKGWCLNNKCAEIALKTNLGALSCK